jgi:hypothetical protein
VGRRAIIESDRQCVLISESAKLKPISSQSHSCCKVGYSRRCDRATMRVLELLGALFGRADSPRRQTRQAQWHCALLLLGDLDERSDAAVHGVAPTVCMASQSDQTSPLEVRGEGFCG